MDRYDTAVSRQEPGPGAPAADLETLVAEIGATYPLMAYTGHLDEGDGVGMLDSMIFAGLVTP